MKIKVMAAALVAAVFAVSCGGDGDSSPKPESLRFEKESYRIELGHIGQPNLLIAIGGSESKYDVQADPYKVEWSTADPAVAAVTAEGVVSGISYGTTTLVARSASVPTSASAEITIAPEALRLGEERYVLTPGATVKPLLLVTGSGRETETENIFGIVWSTADGQIAAVATDGTVTAVGYGTTELVGTSSEFGLTLTAEIAVELEGLRFEQEQYTVEIGGSVLPRLLMTENGVEKQAGDGLGITWAIADGGIASLGEDGTVQGLQNGTTTLTVRTPYYSQEVSTRIVVRSEWSGEWMLSLWNDSDAMAGRVYMELAVDGTFTLYQSIDVAGFSVFKGTYEVAVQDGRRILSGVYDDGVAWSTRYVLSCSGDELQLTSLSDEIVSKYVRTEIPPYVKDGATGAPMRAAVAKRFF